MQINKQKSTNISLCANHFFSFSMFVKDEIRQKLNNVPKTKGH